MFPLFVASALAGLAVYRLKGIRAPRKPTLDITIINIIGQRIAGNSHENPSLNVAIFRALKTMEDVQAVANSAVLNGGEATSIAQSVQFEQSRRNP